MCNFEPLSNGSFVYHLHLVMGDFAGPESINNQYLSFNMKSNENIVWHYIETWVTSAWEMEKDKGVYRPKYYTATGSFISGSSWKEFNEQETVSFKGPYPTHIEINLTPA